MKVSRISFSSNSNTKNLQNPKHTNTIDPFLYYQNDKQEKGDFKTGNFRILTASLALLAVAVTLFNIRGKKMLPDNIVDLAEKDLGLNKFNELNKHTKTIDELKSKILYPVKCTLMGDKSAFNNNNYKSGFILTGQNADELKEFMAAFSEHAQKLNIHCLNMKPDLKRYEKIKWVHRALRIADQNYKETKKTTIINLGDLSHLAEMQVNKSQKAKIEKLLQTINKENHPGVVWSAWTDKPNKVGYFYNYMPIMITKLVD